MNDLFIIWITLLLLIVLATIVSTCMFARVRKGIKTRRNRLESVLFVE